MTDPTGSESGAPAPRRAVDRGQLARALAGLVVVTAAMAALATRATGPSAEGRP